MMPELSDQTKITLTDLLKLATVFCIQLIFENLIHKYFLDRITFTFSVVFLINILVFNFYSNRRLFTLLQVLCFGLYLFVDVPHQFYFNIFSFYSRINYLFLNAIEVISTLIFVVLFLIIIFFVAKTQFTLLGYIRQKFQSLLLLFTLLLTVKCCWVYVHPLRYQTRLSRITDVVNNPLTRIATDYRKFNSNTITYYKCAYLNNLSPSLHYLTGTGTHRDLLIIVESWGKLRDTALQLNCKRYLSQKLTPLLSNVSRPYSLQFGQACFHGNTSAAEARELLNFNDEESYQAFLNNSGKASYNLVAQKKAQHFYTIAGFSASAIYGSNWSNAEGFRKKLGFDSRFYYEDLIKTTGAERNTESPYKAVNDELMIDSLFAESKKHEKVFAYGLTINTHQSFKLNFKHVDITDYSQMKGLLTNSFQHNSYALDQFYRISELILHVGKLIRQNPQLFDRILLIGDHANPDQRCRTQYNQTEVPFILIKQL